MIRKPSVNNLSACTEAAISLSAHSIQNHPRQVYALGHDSRETSRRAAYILVLRQTNGRYDRGGNGFPANGKAP